MVQILIDSEGDLFIPEVEEGISWQTDRFGTPGTLKFSIPKENIGRFEEGDHVALQIDGQGIFYGFVFTKKSGGKSDMVEVTAYDQLRYFKNKDTYVYEDKTAGDLIRMLAADFQLQAGEIEDTGFRIASRVEDNSTLFDIVQNALNFLVEPSSGEEYSYTSSIDSGTYNKVKLSCENGEAGVREIYIAQDSSRMNKWGVLQYYDTVQEGENGAAKADALLSLYNQPTRNLTFSNLFGDVNVRAGSLIVVKMNLGDMHLENLMLVEKCKHVFQKDVHYMDLTVRGGEFVA